MKPLLICLSLTLPFVGQCVAEDGPAAPIALGNRKRLTWDDSLFERANGIRFEMHRPQRTGERNLIAGQTFIDPEAPPAEKYRMLVAIYPPDPKIKRYLALLSSPDGLRWTKPDRNVVPAGDFLPDMTAPRSSPSLSPLAAGTWNSTWTAAPQDWW